MFGVVGLGDFEYKSWGPLVGFWAGLVPRSISPASQRFAAQGGCNMAKCRFESPVLFHLGADREHFPRPSHHADRPAESELCARHLRGFAERGPVLTWGNASFSDHRKSCLAWHCPSSGAEVSWQVSGLPAGSICLLACDGLWDAGASIHWGPLRATQPRVGRLTTD